MTLVARVSRAMNPSWGAELRPHLVGQPDGEGDAVPDVEAGVAPGLLDQADEVAGQPLGGQLGRHGQVEHDDAVATGQRGAGRLVRGDEAQGVLALLERDPAGDDRGRPSRSSRRPSPR